jgi:class 3 adenylate cyclase/tetratricopeptide (TPR) repeat protein
MTCPACNALTRPGATFCGACGAPLARTTCAGCATELPASARFCPACGRSVAEAPTHRFGTPDTYTPRRLADRILTDRRSLEGERKLVTVLFADLRGSMELIVDRDAEHARRVLDEVLELMMEAVHRYEGTVNQVMGDGIMALFGAPVAHEDHAVRACYAALRMQEHVQRWAVKMRSEVGIAVAIRVGLNSGEVLVRAIGSDLAMDYTAVGRPTHLAARFEQMATPGTTLLSRETLTLAEGFIETRALGPVPVRGLDDPVELFELLGASSLRTRFQRAAAQGFTRFVGRDPEVAALHRAAAEAARGHGRAVAVVGEAGVGKSRLVWEVSRTLDGRGWRVFEGRCVSSGRSSAYVPVVEMLGVYFDVQAADDGSAMRQKIARRLLELDPSLAFYLPAFLALFDVPTEDQRWQDLDPLERRRETMDAVRRLLVRESRLRPVLAVFDDLQWVDAETQALLDAAIEATRGAALLLVLGSRPEYNAPWTAHPHCEKLRLEPLSPAGADLLLDALLGPSPDLAPLRRLLQERAEGNPFFVEESVAMLAADGVLAGERGRYVLARAPSVIRIPETVRAVLAARIDQLEPEDKGVLEASAVIGKDVPLRILQAVAELPDERLHASIARLQNAEFLYEARLFPEIEYVFKHPLTHEIAYNALAQERRRAMHCRVVATLERQFDAARLDERVSTLAYHAFHGGLWQESVTWLRRAGAKAALRSASAEAVARFEQALEALSHLPSSRPNIVTAMDLRFELRNPLFLLADLPRALAVLEEVRAMAESIGDEDRLGRACSFMANAHFMLGAPERGLELAVRAREIGDRTGDAALLAFTWCHLGQLQYVKGDHAAAVASMARCTEGLAAEEVPSRRTIVQLYTVVALCFVALAEANRGRFAEATAAGERCAGIAEESNAPFYRALGSWALGTARLIRGDAREAVALLEQARADCDRAEIRSIRPWIVGDLGLALLLAGRDDEATSALQAAVEEGAALRLLAGQSRRLEHLAQAYLRAGRLAEATETARQAVAMAKDHGEQGFRAWALHTQAGVAAARGDAETAPALLAETLALATETEMVPLAARCHLDAAVLCARGGDRGEAVRRVGVAIGMFRDAGMPMWLERSEALALEWRGSEP